MASFEQAIPTVLKHEGGYVNNPLDPGGETNFGISSLFIRRELLTAADLGLEDLKPGALKSLTVEKASEIYKRCFWDRNGYDQFVDQGVATKVFDAAVNCGPKTAHMMAQRAANKLGALLDVDGALGTKSFGVINVLTPMRFLVEMASQMSAYYRGIVASHPSQVVFLNNWLKRANS